MTGKRILVIEDEFMVALDIQVELRDAGFGKVEHAATEGEALSFLQEGQWDAVVADANLDGRGIGRIVAMLNTQRIPFVVVTGYDRESLPPEVARAPLMQKPFSGPRLVQMVKSLCSE